MVPRPAGGTGVCLRVSDVTVVRCGRPHRGTAERRDATTWSCIEQGRRRRAGVTPRLKYAEAASLFWTSGRADGIQVRSRVETAATSPCCFCLMRAHFVAIATAHDLRVSQVHLDAAGHDI